MYRKRLFERLLLVAVFPDLFFGFIPGLLRFGFVQVDTLGDVERFTKGCVETVHDGVLTLQVDLPVPSKSARLKLYDADPVETTTTKTFDLGDITPADDTRIYVRVEKEPNG